MARKKYKRTNRNCKAKKSKFRPSALATGIWYVLTVMATALLTALLLGIVLKDSGDMPAWMFIVLAVDVLFIVWLIYTRRFTTSETIAWRTRRR